jgi:hypothetical protein
MCAATGHVRFAPNSERESGFPQTVMSALPPKADMCVATRDVRFGPKADIVSDLRVEISSNKNPGNPTENCRDALLRSISYNQFSPPLGGVVVPGKGQTPFVNFNTKRPLSWHVLQSVPSLAFRWTCAVHQSGPPAFHWPVLT